MHEINFISGLAFLCFMVIYSFLAYEDYSTANKKGEGEVSILLVLALALIALFIPFVHDVKWMIFTVSLITWGGLWLGHMALYKKPPFAWADWVIVLATPLFLTQLFSFYVFITLNAVLVFGLFKNKPYYPMFATTYVAFIISLMLDFWIKTPSTGA